MKKILISFSMIFLLIGCSKNDFDYYKDSYIEEQGITNINEMMSYEEKPDIKLIVFKGRLDDNEEYLYCFEGLPGSKKDGEYKNGSYTGILLEV